MSTNQVTAEITTELDVKSFAPGESLSGQANWMSSGPITSAELRLFYYTEGRGTQDVELVETQQMQVPGAFAFQLPDGPYSFSGRLITLAWALELIIHPGDSVTRLNFVLSPSAEEIDLTRYKIPEDIAKLTKKRTGLRRTR